MGGAMSIRIREEVVDQVGTLRENGGWGGNGVVDVGERVKGTDGRWHKVVAGDLASFKAFDQFLEMISGGWVDFFAVRGNQFRYMLYRNSLRGREVLKVVDAAGRNLADAPRATRPNETRYRFDYFDKVVACDDDIFCAMRAHTLYDQLLHSAAQYVRARDWWQDETSQFVRQTEYRVAEIDRYVGTVVREYTEAYRQWQADEFLFDTFRPAPGREPEPEWASPLPPPPGRPGRLPPPDRGGGNNPDKDDDF